MPTLETDTGTPTRAARVAALTCPRCDAALLPGPEGWADSRCRGCGTAFRTLVATVRAKKAVSDKGREARDYRVRVKYGDTEELIGFAGGSDDIEMKAGDGIAFVYRRGTLCLVQNLTLDLTTRFRRPRSWLEAVAAGIVVLATLLALKAWLQA